MPAFAAQNVFERVQKVNPAYSYREPALNPTNPNDRPTAVEVELINRFRAEPQLGELTGIREAETGLLVLEHRMDGPWLFAKLPVGRYEIEATLQDLALGRIEIERGSTTIHANDRHQMLLYFDTGEAIGERAPGQRPPNPYEGEAPVRR